MEKQRIGWIGLGNMGTPMASNLVKAGFDTYIYNRTASKAQSLVEAGATLCASYEALCDKADVIFTMLSDDNAAADVFGKLLQANVADKLFVNMSTISPALAVTLAQDCKTKGAGYLDAPVSGSVKPATDGTLLILAAGDKADYDRATPLLDKLGKLTLHLGAVGQGSKAKLGINYYMGVIVAGIGETVAFAQANGVSKEQMLEIINESACGSPMSKMKTPSILADNYPVAFPLKYILKDILLAQKEGLNTAMSHAAASSYQKAVDEGYGELDLMAVMRSQQ